MQRLFSWALDASVHLLKRFKKMSHFNRFFNPLRNVPTENRSTCYLLSQHQQRDVKEQRTKNCRCKDSSFSIDLFRPHAGKQLQEFPLCSAGTPAPFSTPHT